MRLKLGVALFTAAAIVEIALVSAAWISEPPRAARSAVAVVSPTGEPDAGVERRYCAGMAQEPPITPGWSTTLARSGAAHYTLAALASQYGDTPSAGARAQVLVECKRLELLK